MHKRKSKEPHFPGSLIVYGRNAVKATYEARNIKDVFVSPKRKDDPLTKKMLESGLDVGYMDEDRLGDLSGVPSSVHQGFVCTCDSIQPMSLTALLGGIKRKDPVLLILDGIEDPVNLGSIIRGADAFGIDGVIIKERGQSPITATVAKISTGAFNFVRFAAVSNLSGAIRDLKKQGFWIVGTDGYAKTEYDEIDYSGKMAIVVGSEGFGISRLVKENCDYLVKIPMLGHVNSLNAAVAASIFMAMANLKRK